MSDDCLAKRWNGTPCYEGPHDPHEFTYGNDGYLFYGHCGGRAGDPQLPLPVVHLQRKPPPTLEDLEVQVSVMGTIIEMQAASIEILTKRIEKLERRLSGPHG